VQPSAHHATGSPHAQPRLMCIFYFSSLGRVGDVDAYSHGALQRRRSRTHAATSDTTRRPCASASARRDVDNRAAELARSTQTAARLSTFDSKHAENQPVFDTSARERVTAHLRLLERVCWSSRTHTDAIGAAKCSPRHGKPARSA